MDQTRSKLAAIAVLTVIFCVTLLVYVVGYFALSDVWGACAVELRSFQTEWQACLYEPAAQIESYLTGELVWTSVTPDP